MQFDRQSQAKTPLLDALWECANKNHAPFYTPGHKRGQGISQKLVDCFGSSVFRADLPELVELDNLFAPQGVIQQAEELAAAAFGAEHTWFLVNGSTCGVEAAILATCAAGDKIILPRNVHYSAIAGLILSGAIPIFVYPEYDPVLDIAHSITPEKVADALKQHPDAKAVMMVYPTYYGVCGNVEAIATLAHQYNIPLLVDEAHGSHFAFHPELPKPALAAGADLTVQSIHKVLGAMTQASMLHTQGSRVSIDRVSKSLQLLQSTSPSYLLLASLDAARQQMAMQGEKLMARTLQLADTARNRIDRIPGLSVLQSGGTTSGFALDRTRLTVTVSGLGLTGFEADEILTQELGVIAELPSLQHLTFIITLGNTEADIDRLVEAFTTLSYMKAEGLEARGERLETRGFSPPASPAPPAPPALFPSLLTPREAFFAPTETLSIEQTSDRLSAELVCPYPPGIPVLMPGEVITPEALDYLQKIQKMGGILSGCADPSLLRLKVVKTNG
jgi:arginine decarboxylase